MQILFRMSTISNNNNNASNKQGNINNVKYGIKCVQNYATYDTENVI